MRKLSIILLLLLQAFAYAGPVCGTHLTAAESVACCNKAHCKKAHSQKGTSAVTDSSSDACCRSCNLGKVHARKQKDPVFPLNQNILFTILPSIPAMAAAPEILHCQWSHQKFTSFDPPEILLITQSFRI